MLIGWGGDFLTLLLIAQALLGLLLVGGGSRG